MVRSLVYAVLAVAVVVATTACCSVAQGSAKPPDVVKVDIDSTGKIHITDSAGKEVVPPEDKDQADCASPKVADDKQTVGWLAEYPNPSNSYPLPLALVLYRAGKVINQITPGQSIWDWQFVRAGNEVAFWIGPTHGDFVPHFELHDVRTGKQLAQWNGHLDQKHPSWVDGLKE